MKVNRAAPNAPSVVYDAVIVPAGVAAVLAAMPLAQRFMHEMFRHGKPISVASDATVLLEASKVTPDAEGVAVADGPALATSLVTNLSLHRFPRRVSALRPT